MSKIIQLYLDLYHFWMKWPEKLRYLLVGGFNTTVFYGLFALFFWLDGQRHEQQALFLAFLVSSLNSYWTQKIYVFATCGHYGAEYLKCLFSWAVGYVVNAGLLKFFKLFLNVYIAEFFALALATVIGYLLLKHFAFHPKRRT